MLLNGAVRAFLKRYQIFVLCDPRPCKDRKR